MILQEKGLYPAIVRAGLALAHLLPLLLLLIRRQEKRRAVASLILYCALSAVWGLGVALAALEGNQVITLIARVASFVGTALPVLLVALLVSIALQNLDRRGHWIWGVIGGVCSLTILGLYIFFEVSAAGASPAEMVGLVGWLVSSSLVIFLSAWWMLRAPLAFYRNRGIYVLVFLALLLAGHGLGWVQGWWGEISLMLHLVGTISLVVFTTVHELPNLKELLRRAIGNTLLTITTALLLLLGLLVGQFFLWTLGDLTVALVVSAALAIVLSLVYRPFHRFITWLVNRIVWRKGYDPTQVLREYGRTVSSLLTMEQLATVAVGTVSDVLGVQRGALIIIARGVDRVTLHITEGMGHVEKKEIALALDSPILLHLMMGGESFFQYDLDRRSDLQGATLNEKEALRSLGMEIYLPILARERLLGLLALGPQRQGEPYGQREVNFLTTLAQQTGVALQNAYMFSEMQGLYNKISGLNEDLRAAYLKLMKLDKAKTDFLSIASHELRTPLTVIQGYTGILEEMAANEVLKPEQGLEIARNLKMPIERLAAIVTSMLDASTIEVKALDLQYTTTTLRAVISMATGQWLTALEERSLEMTEDGIDGIPPIEVDLQRLSQAFSNMFSNAIKYTPDGGRISIQARLTRDKEHFEVVIADTGVGIDPGDQELIFEKFYRVGDLLLHSTGETKFKGAGPGLGLHIARGVIEAHSGRIWVESPGHDEEECPGSAFHVEVPLKPEPASPEAE